MRKPILMIRGVRVRIDCLSVLCLAAMLAADPSVCTLLVLAAAFTHETGHLIALAAVKCRVREIRVCPVGAVIDAELATLSYTAELAVTVAGAAANAAAFAVCFPLGRCLDSRLLLFFAAANAALAIVNLCPAKTLDGGRALSLTLLLFLPPDKADAIADGVGDGSLLLLAILCVRMIAASGGNFSLLMFCVAVFLAGYAKEPTADTAHG